MTKIYLEVVILEVFINVLSYPSLSSSQCFSHLSLCFYAELRAAQIMTDALVSETEPD